MNWLVGWSYKKAWPRLGISYYEHQYDHMLGPGYYVWQERGILGNHAIPRNGLVLDICCGDGFYDSHYYSTRARHVDAFDRDPRAIKTAKSGRPGNVTFWVHDALTFTSEMNKYDAILMFASLEHFTPEQGHLLLDRINAWLKPGGVFLGSTPVFEQLGGHNDEHQNEFLTEVQLREFLKPHFSNIYLWSSPWTKGRLEYYFRFAKPELSL